jgi:DNA-binding HxlR family transcriptional regulator
MSSVNEPLCYPGVMLGRDYDRQDCALARALEVVGERWTLLVVRDAFYGVQRFNDFQAHLDIPRAVLTDRLDGLVGHGVLARRPDPTHAGRSLYVLTERGRDLWPAVYALLSWGDRHREPNSRVFLHADCDTPLDHAGRCPACGVTPEPGEILTTPRRRRRPRRQDHVALALAAPRRLLQPIDTG